MKLLLAKFQNFRMLRDLELEFSHDPGKRLTVIRAANESGKTTILHGLQWALYGDEALPAEGDGFRLHPIDWKASEGKFVTITATLEFMLTKYRRSQSGVEDPTQLRYRLIRSATEHVDGNSPRSPSIVKLFKLTDTGARPISEPEPFINDEMPPKLREVFFTDGDRALSFIEARVKGKTNRERVQGAIHSLLGLEVINAAIKHVRNSATEVNRKAKKLDGDDELNSIAKKFEDTDKECIALEEELEDAKQQFRRLDESCSRYDREISAVLVKGDKEELKNELERVREDIKSLDQQRDKAEKGHSELFRSETIASDLLTPALAGALDQLEELRDRGKIPNATIPVLQGRLEAKSCICGETLEPGNAVAEMRREHIQNLIDDSHRADEVQNIITDLYYNTRRLRLPASSRVDTWLGRYDNVIRSRDEVRTKNEKKRRQLRALELKLDSLPDTDVKSLREKLSELKDMRDRYLTKQAEIKTSLKSLRVDRQKLEQDRDRLLRQQKKGEGLLAQRDVTQDIMKVLQGAYEQITTAELLKVSDLMNSFFLEMIGADPEQGALIQRAEIRREFDIIVYGPDGRTQNPDRDLNGASRRALTLAFILALTKVSEVEAPNVIDTPLGMTSGFVKQSILRTTVRESKQLILLLTHDEIAGCEEVIDESAGIVFTLTNSAHYPKMLIHDPGVVERKALRCTCNHRGTCKRCQRRQNSEVVLDIAS